MITLIYIGLIFILFSYFLSKYNFRVSFIHFSLFYITCHLISTYNHYYEYGNIKPFLFLFLNLVIFFVSILFFSSFNKIKSEKNNLFIQNISYANHSLLMLSSIVIFFILYHYYHTGIPILNENIEAERFKMNKAGLWGIPGRMNLYGPIFVLSFNLLICNYSSFKNKFSNNFLYLNTFIFCFAMVISGFKGGVFNILILISILYFYCNNIEFKLKLRKILIFLIFLSIFAIIFIASIYLSVRGASFDLSNHIFDRIFFVSGGPFYFLIDSFIPKYGGSSTSYMLRDIDFILSIFGLGDSYWNSLQEISADFHNRPVFKKFNVPITINYFGYVILNFGLILSFFSSILLAFICSKLYFLFYQSHSIVIKTSIIYIQIMVFSVITKGNVVYDIFNRFSSLIIILVMLFFCQFLLTRFSLIKLSKDD